MNAKQGVMAIIRMMFWALENFLKFLTDTMCKVEKMWL